MQNAEHQMHCLLAVNFTHVWLRLALIGWKGPKYNTMLFIPDKWEGRSTIDQNILEQVNIDFERKCMEHDVSVRNLRRAYHLGKCSVRQF